MPNPEPPTAEGDAAAPDAWGDAAPPDPHVEAARQEEEDALNEAVQRFQVAYLQDRVVRLNATMRQMAEDQLRATMDTPKAAPDLDPVNGST